MCSCRVSVVDMVLFTAVGFSTDSQSSAAVQ